MKPSENDVRYSNFSMGEMDEFRQLYSREGDNSSRFEEKTAAWEHTVVIIRVCDYLKNKQLMIEMCCIELRVICKSPFHMLFG